ncbi:hypothetical protein CY34DRAFT_16777 [Suillus luteus UH-Slu-Lm8-n1]|uniref:Uncharacterized protein n=1 Tax=Suillus luteus UH-Slu-Lm8-n1 TaxID=930992 RepID=A0A0D0ANG4_9AGAM|nr:hypothetical protein CY34DRAFT_16777 [Suillus luteus UH-Slu-Lm8-n1]
MSFSYSRVCLSMHSGFKRIFTSRRAAVRILGWMGRKTWIPDISSTITSEQPDQKFVKATLARAKAGVDGIGVVSGKVENVVSASDHLQSTPDTIDSFSKILKTFEKFHSVATTLANVRPYAVALGIFTCASKTRQNQDVVGPMKKASKAITAPVQIVIDALDESGDTNTREHILDLLSQKMDASSSQSAELPANARIIIISRPFQHIRDALDASHVRHISMDDIPPASTHNEIQLYILKRLAGLRNFNDAHFNTLAEKSNGLFEWARLACEYIKGTNKVGPSPADRFHAVATGTSETGTRLLDMMYARILEEIMLKHEHREAMPVFCFVMGRILSSLEPLPMRLHFPDGRNRYNMEDAIRSLGSLVTSITDPQTPVRPLHMSFYDFLTDKSQSHDFFIDSSLVQGDLAFASLWVMASKRWLRFNICSLETSYLPNSPVPDLEKRVKDSIPAQLSYSS